VGKLSPSTKELSFLRDEFSEAAMFTGQEVTVTLYMNYDPNTGVVSDPVTYSTGVFFDEYPNVRTLKSLSWYSEDDEILPSIIYIPKRIEGTDVEIREESKLDIQIGNYHKQYRFANVRAPYLNEIYFTCKLTPWFDKTPRNTEDGTFNPDTHEGKYSFFDVDK
jgi:hypothetical protein